MIRILEIFGEPISRGGQESYILSALKNMDLRGLHFDFFTPYYCDNSDFVSFSEEYESNIFEGNIPFLPGKSRKAIIDILREYLHENTYDVVHIHSGSNTVLAYCAMVAKKCGIKKVIVHSHCTADRFDVKHMMVLLYSSFYINRYATDVLACSRAAAKSKFCRTALRRSKVAVNGVETSRFSYDPEIRRNMRELYEIEDDVFVLGQVGRFAHQKNQLFTIRLFKQIKDNYSNLKTKLILVGDGPDREKIEELIKKYDLSDDVILAGTKTNVEDYLQLMDVFIFPSTFEGLGIVAIEAESAGLPVVASDAIPRDIALLNDVSFIGLDKMDDWVDKVISYKNYKRTDTSKIVSEKGFEVKDTAKMLRDIYTERTK